LLGLGLVLPKTRYFLWVFHFLKPYSPNHPTQPTFLSIFWVGLTDFLCLPNSCTPLVCWGKTTNWKVGSKIRQLRFEFYGWAYGCRGWVYVCSGRSITKPINAGVFSLKITLFPFGFDHFLTWVWVNSHSVFFSEI